MKNTTNYGLKKPDGTDAVDIAIINQNMDTIDARMKSNATQISDLKEQVDGLEVSWDGITGKPATFPPSTHSHAYADITGKPSIFPPSPHTDHSEINTGLIKGKALTTSNKQLINHTSDSVYVGNPTIALSLESKDEIRANIGGKVKTVLHSESVINADTVDGKHAIDFAPNYKSANGYFGMVLPNGSDAGWIRTPSLGLLPYASGGGTTAGSLGTSSWKFKEIHGVDIFANGVNVGTEINNLKSIVNNPKVVKSVQRGLLNSSVKGSKENGIYYQDVVIASVVMTKALVLVTSTDAKPANARLVNATTLRIYSGAQYGGDSFDATNCNWQVIEFY